MRNIIDSYFLRHQNPINLTLHLIGIPLVILGVYQLFMKRWRVGLTTIFIGYLIQYLGHLLFEHNQMGEWVLIVNLIKKITG